MRDDLRGKLNTAITRKQFLQYSAMLLLTVFGVDNFMYLVTGKSPARSRMSNAESSAHNGFGSRKFGA